MINELLNQVDRGRLGKNWGLSMGLPKLEEYIDGVSQGTYTILFSASGVGKTSLALNSYIYRPLMDIIKYPDFHEKYEILYISLEINELISKFVS